MAGIAFQLRALAEQRGVGRAVSAYTHAGFLVAGPWIFTVLALAGITLALKSTSSWYEIQTFRSVIIYNFCASLIATGPISMLATRYIADQVYQRDTRFTVFALLGSVAAVALVLMPLAAFFYAWLTTLPTILTIMAIINFGLISVIWLTIPFLTILREYSRISWSFVAGFLLAVITCIVFADYLDATLILLIFNLSLAIILTIIISRILSDFPGPVSIDPQWPGFVRRRWNLLPIGFFYFAGIWVDKLLIWFFSKADNVTIGALLKTTPVYDATMFKAQLLIIPAFIYFFVHVETGFYERFRILYASITNHATLRHIEAEMKRLADFVTGQLVVTFVLFLVACALLILALPVIHQPLGLEGVQMSIFRFGLIGTALHTVFLFCLIFLLYFDLRTNVLLLSGGFMLLNGVLTWASLGYGPVYYGSGYLAASAISLLVALMVLWRELPWLSYHAFVTNNDSLRAEETTKP